MNSKIIVVAAFAIGGAIGAGVTWIITKKKYSDLADKEIQSYREAKDNYDKQKDEKSSEEKIEKTVQEEKSSVKNEKKENPSMLDYARTISESNSYIRNDYARVSHEDSDRPYVITPDEFGNKDDYDVIGLYYFADGVVTDDQFNMITNVDEIIGIHSLKYMGQYEDDAVHVRNDILKADYEVVLDLRKYSEISRPPAKTVKRGAK